MRNSSDDLWFYSIANQCLLLLTDECPCQTASYLEQPHSLLHVSGFIATDVLRNKWSRFGVAQSSGEDCGSRRPQSYELLVRLDKFIEVWWPKTDKAFVIDDHARGDKQARFASYRLHLSRCPDIDSTLLIVVAGNCQASEFQRPVDPTGCAQPLVILLTLSRMLDSSKTFFQSA